MIAKITPIVLLTLFISIFIGCEKKIEDEYTIKESTEVDKRDKTKSSTQIITLKTTENQTIELTALENGIKFSGYEGKVVILNFFATWCPPCIAEIPHLNDIQIKYKDSIQIIAVLMEESRTNQEIELFIDEHKIVYPVTNSIDNFILSDAFGGISSLPTTIIYDKTGNYFNHFIGLVPQEMLETVIQRAVSK